MGEETEDSGGSQATDPVLGLRLPGNPRLDREWEAPPNLQLGGGPQPYPEKGRRGGVQSRLLKKELADRRRRCTSCTSAGAGGGERTPHQADNLCKGEGGAASLALAASWPSRWDLRCLNFPGWLSRGWGTIFFLSCICKSSTIRTKLGNYL